MANIVSNICSLYMNGSEIDFNSNIRPSYILNGLLELRSAEKDGINNIEFLEINDGSKHFYLSTKVLLKNICYEDIKVQSMLNGSNIITLNGVKYRVKIPSVEEWNKYVLNKIGLTSLITPTQKDLSGSYTDDDIINSVSNNVLHWYEYKTITSNKDGYNVTVIGGTNIGAKSTTNQYAREDDKIGFRLMLEKYNTPPEISLKSSSIGSYTSPINISYSVSDVDDEDLIDITEKVDNTIIRTIKNQQSGKEFMFSLNDNWDDLYPGNHHGYIIVKDSFGNEVSTRLSFRKIVENNGATSSLAKPKLDIYRNNSSMIPPIDATKENNIGFSKTGGEYVYYNELMVMNNDDGNVVYNRKMETFNDYHTLPANSLENGKVYQVKLRTYDKYSNYSEWSNVLLLKTFDEPEVYFTNIINGEVRTQNPIFVSTYSQSNNEKLYSYKFILSKNGATIQSSPEIKYDSDTPISYQFTGLNNKENYNISIIILTESGIERTYSQDFYCVYNQNRLNAVLELENIDTEGAIYIKSYVRQIIGNVKSGSIYFEDDEWANLHDGVVSFDENSPFNIDSDFVLEMWAKDFEDNGNFLINLNNELGYIKLSRNGNFFFLEKHYTIDGDDVMYQLNQKVIGDLNPEDQIYFYIKHLKSTGIMDFEVKRITRGTTTWYKPKHANDSEPDYYLENGFLTNLENGLNNLIIPKLINNMYCKFYIPSYDEIFGDNRLDGFVGKASSKIGECVIGTARIGSSKSMDNVKCGKKYFTRTADTEYVDKLIMIDEEGNKSTCYPNDSTVGNRYMFDIYAKTLCSKVPIEGCHYITTNQINIFDTIRVIDLNIGDKVKNSSFKYNGESIEFMVVSKNEDIVTLITTDVYYGHIYDSGEGVFTNGNVDWECSNLSQWLNSNSNLVR